MVARSQARAVGATPSGLRHRLGGPDWELLSPRVLRLAGSPRTARQRLMARGRRATPEVARLHEPRLLPPKHVTTLDAIPVTTLARTLFDLAGTVHPERAERAVDNALARCPSLLPQLHVTFEELAARRRPGTAVMRAILASRPADFVPPASGLEARAIALLGEAGIRVRRQVDVGRELWIGRVDLLDDEAGLVIEVDSAPHHSSRLDRERDDRRDAALRMAGFGVVRVTDEEAWIRPHALVAKVLAARARRLGQRIRHRSVGSAGRIDQWGVGREGVSCPCRGGPGRRRRRCRCA